MLPKPQTPLVWLRPSNGRLLQVPATVSFCDVERPECTLGARLESVQICLLVCDWERESYVWCESVLFV